ncbi:MAG: DNA primase, partial [Bacteroidetes bacterium RIFCSPLOWO2_02_FULL_36_8]
MPYIPKDILDQVHELSQNAILDIVGSYVSLKKKGQNYWACCPFHDERTPSFSVNPVKGIYKCFGCAKGGKAIDFVMEMDGCSFPEAIRTLAKRFGIEIPETEQTPEQLASETLKDSLFIIHNFAKTFYHSRLTENETGIAIGLSYLKERGYRMDIIKKFELGYAQSDFTSSAIAAGYQLDLLVKSGVTILNEQSGNPYDRFRDRVIFPIHNLSGKTIAFGARMLKSDKDSPKYLNSPETEIYHKSDTLFGIHLAKNSIRKEDKCILVEGYTDVISMHQAGIENVVASSGTSLTEGQIKLISRFTQNIVIIYDGDPAGIKASMRGIDLILEKGLNVELVLLPAPEDPDSFAKKMGETALREYVEKNKKDFISFKTELLLKETENNPVQKAKVVTEVLQSIARIPDMMLRNLYIKATGLLIGVDEKTLMNGLSQIILKNKEGVTLTAPFSEATQEKKVLSTEKKVSELKEELREREIIRLLLNFGNNKVNPQETLNHFLIQQLSDIEFKHPVYRKILETYRLSNSEGNSTLDVDVFLRNENNEVCKTVVDLTAIRNEPSISWKK